MFFISLDLLWVLQLVAVVFPKNLSTMVAVRIAANKSQGYTTSLSALTFRINGPARLGG